MATRTNFLKERETYNRYYGDFRGVDFSSDHTQVNEHRLAYAVNMYKDYQSSQGQALETIAGFRKRVILPEASEIFGIFHFSHKAGDEVKTKILIHAGKKLYLWSNYPNTVNVTLQSTVTVPPPASSINGTKQFSQTLPENVAALVSLETSAGEDLTYLAGYDPASRTLTYASSFLTEGDRLVLSYKEGILTAQDAIFTDMNARKSASFIFNNRLYIIDGKNYLVYDGESVKHVSEGAYTPLTYINVIPSGANADAGVEYEQRNILQPNFRTTFIADGEMTEFFLNENELEDIVKVTVYGKEKTKGTDFTVDLVNGRVKFTSAPPKPETVQQDVETADGEPVYYPEMYAGIEITAKKTFKSVSGVTDECEEISRLITECTICAIYDNRVFLSGNPSFPNHIFYCSMNSETGYVDPSYFGVLNYMQDGVGIAPITGMITVADTLMVLKSDTQQDGTTYFHTASDSGNNIQPKIYPSTRGLSGVGCLGACENFLDDPIFISRLGVEAVGQLSVRYERATEHRSSLIDAKLVNMNLEHAVVSEWNGYLLLLVDGCIFMADSRQRYTHDTGVPQYEWYYVENVGVYDGQYLEYRYSSALAEELKGKCIRYCTKCGKGIKGCTCGNEENVIEIPISLAESVYYADTNETKNLIGETVNPPDDEGNADIEVFDEGVAVEIGGMEYTVGVYYTVHEVYNIFTGELDHYEAYLCEKKGNNIGGVFKKATVICSMFENVFFGTENGVVCSFNFDMRNAQGEIAPQYYTFDDRIIFSGCATKMDNCDVPHLTKNTVKKSTVIKTKSFRSSAAKVKVRTNRKAYTQIARINNSLFSFEDVDFSEFTFNTNEQSLFSVKEKEKQWVEKQYWIFSDEYMKPFALFYIAYRYQVVGRLKN